MGRRRLRVYYAGRVQGVGFDVTGTVRNLADGRVELIAEGEQDELQAFQQAIRDEGLGRLIRSEETDWSEATSEFRGFEIVR